MRHHTAAALNNGSGFHYASLSSRGGYPLGDCANHAPHATEDEARACYRTWQRRNVVLVVDYAKNWGDCSIDTCGAPGKCGARIDGDGYSGARLCPAHLNVGDAIIALGLSGNLAGDSWES